MKIKGKSCQLQYNSKFLLNATSSKKKTSCLFSLYSWLQSWLPVMDGPTSPGEWHHCTVLSKWTESSGSHSEASRGPWAPVLITKSLAGYTHSSSPCSRLLLFIPPRSQESASYYHCSSCASVTDRRSTAEKKTQTEPGLNAAFTDTRPLEWEDSQG